MDTSSTEPSDIDPEGWRNHADRCDKCEQFRRGRGVGQWIDGRRAPTRPGWYERLFTDGMLRHHWNGKRWSVDKGGVPHWRQVGDYPCWRGLTATAFMRPSRYKVARSNV